jgi:hypothetical protein
MIPYIVPPVSPFRHLPGVPIRLVRGGGRPRHRVLVAGNAPSPYAVGFVTRVEAHMLAPPIRVGCAVCAHTMRLRLPGPSHRPQEENQAAGWTAASSLPSTLPHLAVRPRIRVDALFNHNFSGIARIVLAPRFRFDHAVSGLDPLATFALGPRLAISVLLFMGARGAAGGGLLPAASTALPSPAPSLRLRRILDVGPLQRCTRRCRLLHLVLLLRLHRILKGGHDLLK